MIQPPAAPIEVYHKLLGCIFIAWIIVAKLFNSSAIAGRPGVDRIEAEKRPIRSSHSLKS